MKLTVDTVFSSDIIKPTKLVGFMLKVSTKSQYGLRAMVYLARCREKICPLKLISEKEGISFDYLEKIISKLEKTGLVKSKKGVQGGYSLGRQASRIKIGEIIRALEGNTPLVKCMAGDKRYRCPLEKKCLTKSFWGKIQKSLNSALNSITLADLINR